jgi:PAS domain S-box-containing protein
MLLRSVLDSTRDLIIAVDSQMKVMAFNEPVLERVQQRNQITPYVGMPFEEMLPEIRRKEVLATGARALQGASATLESSLSSADGSPAFFEETYTPIMAADGSIGGFTVFIRTITERKLAELALATNEQRLRQIIDLVPHFIFAKDENGKFILVNQAVAEAYGTTVGELTGKADADFAKSAEEVRHFREDDHAVIHSGVSKHIPEELITDAAGRVRILNTQKIPFTFSGTSSPALLGVSVDITELKRAGETMRASEELYRQLFEMESEIGRAHV